MGWAGFHLCELKLFHCLYDFRLLAPDGHHSSRQTLQFIDTERRGRSVKRRADNQESGCLVSKVTLYRQCYEKNMNDNYNIDDVRIQPSKNKPVGMIFASSFYVAGSSPTQIMVI
ncbi:hypothetical protein PoB_006725700 [Plakobranchus ocellatus]|uniref:Uncharacterized protein n=1 Tax=Plakobranchus ocellatus TaxID=259542 RepID=A0AAV4D9C5_9GAST|nr:hypothetical protein PoB_006725700 [Plakobranchus ocellatus]